MPLHKEAFRAILINVESYWQILLRKRTKVLDFKVLDFRNALAKFYFRRSRRLFMEDV